MAVDFVEAQLPVVLARNERTVHDGFWRKLRRVIGQLPFVEDLVAAYFCAVDPLTPLPARAALVAALAYFIIPIDLVPDFIAGFGYSDDAAALTAAIGIAGSYMRAEHRAAARRVLLRAET
ncbi:MAG: DUF1232 domain-containing protein [Alphaproteobacteria bacterium]|nr:DUF1232 domain-containing protein [Alphaproteobacteria bacterium]